MSALVDRRAFLRGMGALLSFGLAGCGTTEPEAVADQESEASGKELTSDDAQPADNAQAAEIGATDQEEVPMQIYVTVNDTQFTATIEDTAAGQELLARLPLTLSMEELHGNEKYCYTDESFGGETYVPDTIEAGDLMVFGSDCLVLFYETFANGGWSYARVGRIDDPSGLADACGAGTATVTFSPLA